jgi:hypothetical protein
LIEIDEHFAGRADIFPQGGADGADASLIPQRPGATTPSFIPYSDSVRG